MLRADMNRLEKKYRVERLASTKAKLEQLGIKPYEDVTSTHYYARRADNDVVKLVAYSDRNEIHTLRQEPTGTFKLVSNLAMPSRKAGLLWLKEQGYSTLDVVTMRYATYRYQGGLIGLYIINDTLYSVILEFPARLHDAMEQTLGLQNAEVITAPYNKCLEATNKAKTLDVTVTV